MSWLFPCYTNFFGLDDKTQTVLSSAFKPQTTHSTPPFLPQRRDDSLHQETEPSRCLDRVECTDRSSQVASHRPGAAEASRRVALPWQRGEGATHLRFDVRVVGLRGWGNDVGHTNTWMEWTWTGCQGEQSYLKIKHTNFMFRMLIW